MNITIALAIAAVVQAAMSGDCFQQGFRDEPEAPLVGAGQTIGYGGGVFSNSIESSINSNSFTTDLFKRISISQNFVQKNKNSVNSNSRPILVNNTIVDNYAEFGSAISAPNSIPLIMNTIMWDDQDNSDFLINGNVEIQYSCVKGGFVGGGNLDSDPLFVDPSFGSLALNAPLHKHQNLMSSQFHQV